MFPVQKPFFYIAFLFFLLPQVIKAQITEEQLMKMMEPDPDRGIIGAGTVGLLQGGGSLIGVDLEVLATEKIGIQLGAGLVGYGAAINYHPKGGFRSSFFR